MLRIALRSLALGLMINLLPNPASAEPLDYTLFDTYPMLGGYYYSTAASQGGSWVQNERGRLPVCDAPAFTGRSLEIAYVSRAGGRWEARIRHRPIRGQDDWDNGVFIQKKPTPFRHPDVVHMRLYIGDTPVAALPRLALLYGTDRTSAPLALAKYLGPSDDNGWRLASVPVRDFGASVTRAEDIRGVLFQQGLVDGTWHCVFVSDADVRPASDPPRRAELAPRLLSVQGYERHLDLAWTPTDDPCIQGTLIERASDGVHFTLAGYRPRRMSRYTDCVGDAGGTYTYRIAWLGRDGTRSSISQSLSASTHPMTDAELIDMVEAACLRTYWDGADSISGMTLESVPGDPHMVAVGASGFGIMSLVVGAQRGFLPRPDVAARMSKILDFLEQADRFHGAMPHYYDTTTGHPKLFFGSVDNGGDLVETSFLMQGLLTARQFFDGTDAVETGIRSRITRLWEGVEWDWYRKTPDNPYLVWHWSPTYGFKIDHQLIGWNETMITYLLAIASPTHPIPASMYSTGWSSQAKEAQQYRGNGPGKMYRNGLVYYGVRLPVGGFDGGPVFFTHYSFLGMDPHGLRDSFTEYFDNNKAIATINLRYCEENPRKHTGYGDTGWGLTASDGPWSYHPDEPRPDMDLGKLTPTGAIACAPYLPEAAMDVLRADYRTYGSFLWGEYGFRDAFNLDEHWVDDLYMGLNQGPMVVMLENQRSGLLWHLFGSNPEIRAMRQRVFR